MKPRQPARRVRCQRLIDERRSGATLDVRRPPEEAQCDRRANPAKERDDRVPGGRAPPGRDFRWRHRHGAPAPRPGPRRLWAAPTSKAATRSSHLTRPNVVAELHAEYLAVGADVIETNTFGAFDVPLAEYGLEHRTFEINVASGPNRPRSSFWVLHDRPSPLGGRVDRARHQVRLTRANHLRDPAWRIRDSSGRPARGRGGPLHHRDAVRPSRAEGGHCRVPARDGRSRA